MCSDELSPSMFFPEIHGNLTKIVWAHAVNSKALLDSALKNGKSLLIIVSPTLHSDFLTFFRWNITGDGKSSRRMNRYYSVLTSNLLKRYSHDPFRIPDHLASIPRL